MADGLSIYRVTLKLKEEVTTLAIVGLATEWDPVLKSSDPTLHHLNR